MVTKRVSGQVVEGMPRLVMTVAHGSGVRLCADSEDPPTLRMSVGWNKRGIDRDGDREPTGAVTAAKVPRG